MKSTLKYSTLLLATTLVLGISTSFIKASADVSTSPATTETTSSTTLPRIRPTSRMLIDSDGDEMTQDWQEILNGAWAGAYVESGGHYFD